jgi:valyl-tRNA synthetase
MPPPNVTWKLHLWHAIMTTLEDIMIRYHRMKWDSTLWIPWTDHAWIATELKVEAKCKKEWKSKKTMSREEFLEECWEWTKQYGWTIKKQLRKMWASCDWTKERFAFDEWMNKRVNKAFVDLFNKGLIYKWEYMVNYDPVLETVVSDQEVKYREEEWFLYHITYFVSWSDTEIVIATTRPETLLWDVAVAVHPKDKRYKKLVKAGKKLILPIVNKEIPIIADEMVDMDFWTWAVKITPAHDPNDFETAKRHNLPLDEVVLWKNWKMTKKAGIFAWQDYKTARENIVELLKAKWNLVKIEPHVSKVAYSERWNTKLETIISSQWFIKIDPLVKKVIRWYRKKDFEIIPKKFEKVFEDWIFNLRDWCISRQLIWWHRIPIWYGPDWKFFAAETEEDAYKQAKDFYKKDVKLERETDVFDTWFSSWLWPFAILDYNMWWWEQPELVKKFYPNAMMETGHDIIFFWVIRMLLFWYEFTEQTPFKKIYLHWLVRDKLGRKMSKSLGNWIDPLDMIEKYWTDALRLTLSIWNTPWNDLKFDEENVKNNMIFINKLWNASRFVSMKIEWFKKDNINEIEEILEKNYDNLMLHEKWILSRIKYLADEVKAWMEDYSFSSIWQELQVFTKNEFCDYYIEEFKLTDEKSKYSKEVITYVLNKLLKLWHPYIPFVTEEIYKKIWFSWDLIEQEYANVKLERNIEIEKAKNLVIEIIKEVRRLRVENDIKPNKTIKLKIYAKNKNAEIINEVLDLIGDIVKSEETILIWEKPKDDDLAYGIIKKWVEVYVDTSNAIDKEKESARIKEKIEDTKEYIKIIDKKLLNPNFIKNAPDSLVRTEMDKKQEAKNKLEKLEEKLKKLI